MSRQDNRPSRTPAPTMLKCTYLLPRGRSKEGADIHLAALPFPLHSRLWKWRGCGTRCFPFSATGGGKPIVPLLAVQGEGLGRGGAGRLPFQALLCTLSSRQESVIIMCSYRFAHTQNLPLQSLRPRFARPPPFNKGGFKIGGSKPPPCEFLSTQSTQSLDTGLETVLLSTRIHFS